MFPYALRCRLTIEDRFTTHDVERDLLIRRSASSFLWQRIGKRGYQHANRIHKIRQDLYVQKLYLCKMDKDGWGWQGAAGTSHMGLVDSMDAVKRKQDHVISKEDHENCEWKMSLHRRLRFTYSFKLMKYC